MGLEELLQTWQQSTFGVLQDIDVRRHETAHGQVLELAVAFTWLDRRGTPTPGHGRLCVRADQAVAGSALTLDFKAGYAIDTDRLVEAAALGGRVLVSTDTPAEDEVWPAGNPFIRGIGLDATLLMLTRALGITDDAKVLIAGGSAGGWATLMLAAHTYPVMGALPDVPVVNAGAFLRYVFDHAAREEALRGWPLFGSLAANRPLLDAFGADTDNALFLHHSPMGVSALITCPVSAVFSTADMCIPVRGVAEGLVREPLPPYLDRGLVSDDAPQLGVRERLRITDVVPAEALAVVVVPTPDGAEHITVKELFDPLAPQTRTVPVTLPEPTARWTVYVIDEGPGDAEMSHLKHALLLDRRGHEGMFGTYGPLSQLSAAKLAHLCRRYAGIEMFNDGVVTLQHSELEQADVLRSLRTCIEAGGGARLSRVYHDLPTGLQVLPREVVEAA